MEINPFKFAERLLFGHRALYDGPEAIFDGNNRKFYRAFLNTDTHCWPLMCGWDFTWAIIGPESQYPLLSFSPTREACLMEDSASIPNLAKTQRDSVCSTSKITYSVSGNGTVTREETVTVEADSEETFMSKLPSGHRALITVNRSSRNDNDDYRVNASLSEGNEGLGQKNWKLPREQSAAILLARAMNRVDRKITGVRSDEKENSSVDVYLDLREGGGAIGLQVTTIEPAKVYIELAKESPCNFEFRREELLAFVRDAIVRKSKHAAEGVHLLLDCGFLIPLIPSFEADIRTMVPSLLPRYSSILLVCRLSHKLVCVYGDNVILGNTKT